ncbi:MAG: hypothetical protein ACHQ49_03890 [Elusimicrobiota bacterium]
MKNPALLVVLLALPTGLWAGGGAADLAATCQDDPAGCLGRSPAPGRPVVDGAVNPDPPASGLAATTEAGARRGPKPPGAIARKIGALKAKAGAMTGLVSEHKDLLIGAFGAGIGGTLGAMAAASFALGPAGAGFVLGAIVGAFLIPKLFGLFHRHKSESD